VNVPVRRVRIIEMRAIRILHTTFLLSSCSLITFERFTTRLADITGLLSSVTSSLSRVLFHVSASLLTESYLTHSYYFKMLCAASTAFHETYIEATGD
jgi:hypothetical protein